MTVDLKQERVTHLLRTANENSNADNLQKAFQALKEASQLDAQDERVKEALISLQNRESTVQLLVATERFLSNHNESDGEKVLRALRTGLPPADEAVQALERLLEKNGGDDMLDRVTGQLLSSSIDARKHLASKLHSSATPLFDKFFARGPESFKALTGLALEDDAWTVPDQQREAQRDIFQLCIAKLMYVSVSHPERAMRAIARQVAVAPGTIRETIDEDIFRVILDSLDIRHDVELRSQATLATAKLLEETGEVGEAMFTHFITSKVAEQTNDDLIVAFSAASAVFPVIPAVAAKLFLTDGFIQQLVPNLERNSEAAFHGHRKSTKLERAALELLSAACVNKACREAISRYCSSWLKNLSEEREGIYRALAALVLAKIEDPSQSQVTSKLADLVMSGEAERDQAVEGLAYATLQPASKEQIVSDGKVLKILVESFSKRHHSAFGYLTVFSNLTTYQPRLSEEQKKMSQLKAYANSTKPQSDDPLDDDTHVTTRSRKLLEADLVPAMVSFCRQTSSLANVALVVQILLSLSRDQKHRSKMAQQGAVKLLLHLHQRIDQKETATDDIPLISRHTSHALARLLISVNPAHVFSGGLSATSAVSAITPLLRLTSDSEQRDLLPTFEALLALTNLASMEDDSARDLQIRSSFEKVEDLLFSSNELVQQASAELICNLMMSPSGVSKFADGSSDASRRMQILLALTNVENMATRRAIGGALAMLTEWDAAVSAILDKEKGVAAVLRICGDENVEVQHRGFVCLSNIVSMSDPLGTRAVSAVRSANGAEIVRDELKRTKNRELLSIGVDILKKLS